MKLERNHGANGSGKGSYQRPTDFQKFSENFDRIFGKKESKVDPSLYRQSSWCEDEDTFDKNVSSVVD